MNTLVLAVVLILIWLGLVAGLLYVLAVVDEALDKMPRDLRERTQKR